MSTKTLPTPQASATLSDRELELRKNKVGASESAAILGLSPYGDTATDIYHRKVSGVEVKQTRVMLIGQIFEEVLLNYAREELAMTIHKGVRRVDPAGIMQATPDGHVVELEDGGLDEEGKQITTIHKQHILIEAKKVNYFAYSKDPSAWGDSWTDHIPMHYMVQVQHSLEVLTAADGVSWNIAYLVVCIGDDDFRIYQINRHPGLGKKIRQQVEAFWRDHVEAGVEPTDEPPSMNTYAQLNRGGDTVTGLDDRWYNLYALGKKMEKKSADIVDRAKRGALAQAGRECDTMITESGHKLTYREVTTNRIDTKMIRELHPQIAKECTNTTTSRQFRVNQGKKK